MRHSMLIRPRFVVLFCTGCLGACGGPDAPPAVERAHAGVRRFGLERADTEAAAPTVELAGHLNPTDGVHTWEIESPNWTFEEGGVNTPLRLSGPGDKRVLIPGPFDLEVFDRISIMVANAAHGSMRATLTTKGGVEVAAEVDVLKGRAKHPAIIKLPRAVLPEEEIDSLVLEVQIHRAVTIYGIDFIRQPMLATLPSPETGAGLVNVGREARRGVGLGPGEVMTSSFEAVAGETATIWVTGLPLEDGPVDSAAMIEVKLVQPSTPERTQGKSLPVRAGWAALSFAGLEGGQYTVEVGLQSDNLGTVAVVSEVNMTSPGTVAAPASTVILVTSDTHRSDHLGLLRGDAAEALDTPNLDALAQSGVLFESAWTTSNTTIPSHSALLTGRHPRDTKVLGNFSSLGADPEAGPTTLAEAFAAQGYRTVAVLSSSHLAHEYSGLGRGFDLVIRPAGSEARAEESLASALAALDGGVPTFLWLHLFDAHAPYLPPAEFDRRYYPEDRNPFDPSLPEIDLEGGRMPMWLRGLRDHEFARAQYRAEIAYLDSQIGTLFSHPRARSGITAFTSDHGEVFARNGVFYEHKGLTPDTLRVPLIVRAPGLEGAGTRVLAAVRQMDVGRTLLNLAGLPAVEFPGADLFGQDRAGDEPHFAVSRRFASVTQGKWHAILTLSDLSRSKDGHWAARHQLELYDIEADPGCAADLAETQFQQAGRFRKAIVLWLGDADPVLRASRPNLDRAARMNLAALGYAAAADAGGGDLFDPECMCNECLKYK